ncbi:hypothetical protein BDQ12DRAFT_604353, partial [Crucibulum laeve]
VVGYLLNWGLYGVLSVQVYIYYLAFPNDRMYAKVLVYGTYLLETIQSILVAHDAFKAFGQGFGSFSALTMEYFAWLTMPIIGGVVACVVQLFYAYRINILSQSRLAAISIVVMSTIQCVASILAGILAAKAGNLLKLTSTSVRIAQGIWGGVSAACDIAIAVCMSYQLSKRGTGFQPTQALLVKILRLVVGSGAFTAVIAVLNLAFFNGIHGTAYFLVPGASLGKLYSNSMMVILNSRLDIVGGRHSNHSSDVMMQPSSLRRDHRGDSSFRRSEVELESSLGSGKRRVWEPETDGQNVSSNEKSSLNNNFIIHPGL